MMSGILTSNSAKVMILLSLFCFVRISAAATFPRTTVINLPRHASRREHTINELSSKNVKFSWIEAIDGMNMTQSELSGNATALARWFMTPGMIGCFLSHRRCWEQCVRSGKALLVFEDDVILAPNFQNIVTVAISRCSEADLVEKWDVLLLGAMGCVHPHRKYGFNIIASLVGGIQKWRKTRHVANLNIDLNENNGHVSSTEKLLPFIHVPMCPYGMHAYIITPRGASKLLNACPRASFHVDVVAWGLKELNIFAIHPLVAWQTNYDTTIGGFVHLWKKIMPTWVGDSYTGFEMGWALSAPLLRVGGPFFGGKLLLTNGLALALMFIGLTIAGITRSIFMLSITITFVVAVAALVRILSSKWNS